MTTSAAKKTVLHQQLYGSRRCLRPQFQHDFHSKDSQYPVVSHFDEISSCASQRNQCSFQHSQSMTGLPHLRLSESYTTLPSAGMPASHGGANAYSSRWWINPTQEYCCLYDAQKRVTPQCTCSTASYLQPEHQPYQRLSMFPHLMVPGNSKQLGNGHYFGYENVSHITDEEDSAFPGLPERELNLLHRNVPALRRTGVDTAGMRQYFYPDGGWGWIICGLSFLAHLLTTGLQLSYGLLMIFIIQHLHHSGVSTEWLGALSWAISMLVAPFVVSLCRKKSTRLLAVVGGLMLPLGILFTSFATELEQIVFSYGFLFGIGVSMVRDSSAMMLGNYFKRRRNFVEMVAMSGEGVGIALFSVLLREGVGKAGWRLGLQIIAAFLSISFFMALLYRPASLYHPQRRAIQHLKNQRKKMRDDKLPAGAETISKSKFLLLDISPLKSSNVKILVMTSGVAAFGIYAPMFTISLNADKEESDIQDLVLLQAFLGISTTLGVVLAGILVRRPFQIKRLTVTSQVISQVFISTIAVAILFLSFVMGYQGLCILSWIYGIGFGGFRYSLKILALERIKLKQFSKAWGLIRGIESIPVLISVPLTTFLNDYSLKYGRAGYYICSAAAAIAGIIIFFINHTNLQQHGSNSQSLLNRRYENGFISTLLAPPPPPVKRSTIHNQLYGCHEMDCDYHGMDLLSRSCISLNNVEAANIHRANSPVCCRFQLQCFRKAPTEYRHSQPFIRNNIRRRTIDSDVRRPPPMAAQYMTGHGSIGSRTGKRIQKNLSLRSPHYCDLQYSCNNHNRSSNHWFCQDRGFQSRSVLCTCSPAYHLQNCRSLSVPEGLSTISQQCICRTPLPSRTTLYQPFDHHLHGIDQKCAQHDVQVRRTPSMRRNCQLPLSESLTKPMQYVEQMTTSV